MVWDLEWDNVFKKQDWGKYPPECLIRFIAKYYYNSDRKTIKILEVGSGTGTNIWYMAREGFDVYGVEGSMTAVEKAKRRMEGDALHATIIQGDILNLPFQKENFDAVIDGDCLYCNSTEDTNKALSEIKRVLKSGGLFFSRTPTDKMYIGKSYDTVGDAEYKNISDGPLQGKGLARLSNRDMIEAMYGKYFKILSIDREDHTRDNGYILVSKWVIVCQSTSKKVD